MTPLALLVTVPLVMVASLTVSVPVPSTVMVPLALATVVAWPRASPPLGSPSMALLAVTVSSSSALPVPLTLIWPALPSEPLFSAAVPVRSMTPLALLVTVPLVMVASLTVSVPVPSTVMVPLALATVVAWPRASPPLGSPSMALLAVTVSSSSALPVPLTLIWPALPSEPLFSAAVPVRSMTPLALLVTVPLVMVASLTVSVPVPSTVMVPLALATVVPWSRVNAPLARTSMALLAVTVSSSSALPVPLTLIWPALPSEPFFSAAVPVRSMMRLALLVTVPLVMVASLTVSVPVPSTVMVPLALATVVPWSSVSAPLVSTSMALLAGTVSSPSALPVPLTLIWPAFPSEPLFSAAVPVRSMT